jgi:hypothetical protein
MLKSKLFYAMTIAYITIIGSLFGLLYPSVGLEKVAIVIALLGFGLSSASYYLIQRFGFLKGRDR